MATIGGSRANASDVLFDFACIPCCKTGEHREAVKYCTDCQEYLCVTCLEYHNKFAIMAGHKLLGSSEFGTTSKPGSSRTNLPSVPTERCKMHTMKPVDMYCVEHNSVGCHICFTINHKSCQDIHYIPEYIQTNVQTSSIKNIEDEMKKTIRKVEEQVRIKQFTRDENNERKSVCLQMIKDFRAEIEDTLNRLEKATIVKLNEHHDRIDSALEEELTILHGILNDLQKRLDKIGTLGTNSSQQFVSSKVGEKLMSEIERNETVSIDKKKSVLDFRGNPDILSTLHSSSSLGQVIQKTSLYDIVEKTSYDIKQKDDKSDCSIWASCLMDSGDIVAADYNNGDTKLVDGNVYSVRSSLKLLAKPVSICAVSESEVAVTLSDKTVQFLSVGSKLTPTRSLTFDHSCRGIAVTDGNILIGEEYRTTLYVYTMEGELLKKFSRDGSGNKIFSYPRNFCMTADGTMIHVADRDKGLVTVSRNVIVLWRYEGLTDAWGVCGDRDDNVFVSDPKSKTVKQIGPDGVYKGDVVPASYGLTEPQAVCFDDKSSKLIVTDRNKLHVFLIK